MSRLSHLDKAPLQQHAELKHAGDEISPTVFVNIETLRTQLGRELFTWDISRLHEHSELIARDLNLRDAFSDIVLASRNVHEDSEQDLITTTAASNAISVLNYGSRVGLFPFRFGDVGDWSGIRVPKANLNYAVMPYCNLNDTDLSGSSMIGVTLCYSQLQRANLSGIKEHIKAAFEHRHTGLTPIGVTPGGRLLGYKRHTNVQDVQILNFETNESMGLFSGFTYHMKILNFSHDGDYLISAGGNDGTMRIWNMRTYACKAILELNTTSPATTPQHSAAFNPDHCHVATAWKDGLIRIWDIETSQILQTLRHPGVTQLDWSPKGNRIASRSDSDGRILLWDVETYTQVLEIKTHHGVFENFQFSGDGRYVLFSDCDIYVWDTTTGRHQATLQGHTCSISDIVCDPDGCYAYSCDGDAIRTWNLITGECICVLQQPAAQSGYLAVSLDGHNLFSCSKGGIISAAIWNTEALKLPLPAIHDFNGDKAELSPDGRFLATANNRKQIAIYSTETGQLATVVPRYDDVHTSPHSLCYSFDGSMLAYIRSGSKGRQGSRVYVWDFRTEKYLPDFIHDSILPRLVHFHPNKNLLAVVGVLCVELWDCETFQCTACTDAICLRRLSFSPDGRTLGLALSVHVGRRRRTGIIELWDVVTDERSEVITDCGLLFDAVSFSSCGGFVACGTGRGLLHIVSTKTGKRVSSIRTNHLGDVDFHPSGQIIAIGKHQNTIMLCDPALRTCYSFNIRKVPFANSWRESSRSQGGRFMALNFGHRQVDIWELPELQWKSEVVVNSHECNMPTTIVAASSELIPEQSVARENIFSLAVGSSVDGGIFVHANPSGLRIPLEGHSEMVSCMAPSHTTHHLVSGSYDSTVRVWDLVTHACTQIYEGHTSGVTCVQFSPDDNLIASGSRDTTIRVWSISEAKCIQYFEGHGSGVKRIAFSPDMSHIASIGALDHVVRIWDMTTGACSMLLEQHTDEVFDIQYSSDSRYLASGSHDGTIRVWETKTGECIATLKGHTDCLTCFGMTPDGKTIVSGAEDNVIRVWDIATGRCTFILSGHTGHIHSLCLTPDDQCIISISTDHVICIWNLVTGDLLHQLYGHTDAITLVKLLHYDAENESTLVSVSQDGSVRLWTIRNMPVSVKYIPKLQSIIGRQVCINLTGANVTGAQMDPDVARLFKTYGAHSLNATEVCFSNASFDYEFIPQIDSRDG